MKLSIKRDIDPQSPRDWDNLGTISYNHSRYNLGDEKISDPIDWLADMLDFSEERVRRIADRLESDYYSNRVLEDLEAEFSRNCIALPVYLYDHSGITINTTGFSCSWDSGKVGYIWVSKEDIKKEYGWNRITKQREEKIKTYLEGEIETFDQYLTGDVYGFEFEDDEGNEDGCWGFYGTDWDTNGVKDYLPKEAHHLLNDIEIEY